MVYMRKAAFTDPEDFGRLGRYPAFRDLKYCVNVTSTWSSKVGWYHQLHIKDGCQRSGTTTDICYYHEEHMLALVEAASKALDAYFGECECPQHCHPHYPNEVGACVNCFRHLRHWLDCFPPNS